MVKTEEQEEGHEDEEQVKERGKRGTGGGEEVGG